VWTFHALSLTRQDKPGARRAGLTNFRIETKFFPTWHHWLALVGLC
jgi:hypothetical protein